MSQQLVKKPRLRRICDRCFNWFNPDGKFCRICPSCNKRGIYWKKIKEMEEQE